MSTFPTVIEMQEFTAPLIREFRFSGTEGKQTKVCRPGPMLPPMMVGTKLSLKVSGTGGYTTGDVQFHTDRGLGLPFRNRGRHTRVAEGQDNLRSSTNSTRCRMSGLEVGRRALVWHPGFDPTPR